ncbi:fumarylacetoacetase [Ideonella sp. 4Y11]|uniref:fumarylacetoacetase n=1 Tax=Ideonella aquatica TaxID=2824119 RepID=A0A941BFA5_9BURK|nr:fumarylacetoacetase [Ideonella aquatica]MBQ0958556.1 fumarylacetoacetase [Ideonella aquatica]
MLDATHAPTLKSWVPSAKQPGTDFPIQNLPFGRFRRAGSSEPLRVGVAIGDEILDLQQALAAGGWSAEAQAWLAPLAAGDLNAFMAQGPAARKGLRAALSAALREGSAQQAALAPCLVAQSAAEMALPCQIGDYTDFYTSVHHATTVGRLFRPDNPLLPNYKWVPIGYHGRVSSIRPSGQQFPRPKGQFKAPDAAVPEYGPCKRLDYELEMAVFVGAGNPLGQPMTMDQAEADWFGMGLLNDWSARDVQAWEYQPLGPFLSKNFASTISPWIVTQEALAPFRAPFTRPADDPQPLPYLDSDFNRRCGSVQVVLDVLLQTAQMRAAGQGFERVSRGNFSHAYWTVAQMLAHHSAGGCNLQPGDMLGTGTQSGPEAGQGGSLLELSLGGKQPLTLANGEQRVFLQDGDAVQISGRCEAPGAVAIGFGPCIGTVLPAV